MYSWMDVSRGRSSFVFLLLLTCLISFPSSTAAASDQTEHYLPQHFRFKRYVLYNNTENHDLLACETPKAGDLYGLGVRLGIYFNWFTAWVASNFIEDEIAGALDTNAIFLLAIAVAASRSLYTKELFQIDALVLLELCAGTVVAVLSLWGYRTCWYRKEGAAGIRHFGGFGTHLRLLLATAVAIYSIWFWTKGIGGAIPNNTTADPRSNCEVVNVLTLNVHGRVKYVALILGCLSTLYCGAMVIASFIAAYARLMKVVTLSKEHRWASSTKLRYYTGLTESELKVLSISMGIFDLLWIIFAMLFVELTLNQNQVFGVLGENGKILEPSQFLPMLIGTFSFIRILFIAFELWRNPNDLNPSLGYANSFRKAKPRKDDVHGIKLLKLFSPSLAEDTSMALKKTESRNSTMSNGRRDRFSKNLALWQRLLVAWLPWLSLLDIWSSQNYKGLPRSETETSMNAPNRSDTHEFQSPRSRTDYADDDDDDEDNEYHRPGVRFQDSPHQRSQSFGRSEGVSLQDPQHVQEWSPVDAKNTKYIPKSSAITSTSKPEPARLVDISLQTPIEAVQVKDFQPESKTDPIAARTAYERASD